MILHIISYAELRQVIEAKKQPSIYNFSGLGGPILADSESETSYSVEEASVTR